MSADEMEENLTKGKSKQWFWRNFLNQIFLIVELVVASTPVVTFIALIGFWKYDWVMAAVIAGMHFGISIMLIGIDLLKTFARAAGQKWLYLFIANSPTDVYFAPLELIAEPEHLNKTVLDAVNLIDVETKKPVIWSPSVLTYYLHAAGADFEDALFLMPSEFYNVFPFHKEASPLKYPVPTNVSFGAITRMLAVMWNGKKIPVYKVSYAPLFIEWEQKALPWWNPRTQDITQSIQSLDNQRSLQLEMKLKAAYTVIKNLLGGKEDIVLYARMIANSIIQRFLQTFKSQAETSMFGKLGKKILWALIILGIIAVAGIVIWLLIGR